MSVGRQFTDLVAVFLYCSDFSFGSFVWDLSLGKLEIGRAGNQWTHYEGTGASTFTFRVFQILGKNLSR